MCGDRMERRNQPHAFAQMLLRFGSGRTGIRQLHAHHLGRNQRHGGIDDYRRANRIFDLRQSACVRRIGHGDDHHFLPARRLIIGRTDRCADFCSCRLRRFRCAAADGYMMPGLGQPAGHCLAQRASAADNPYFSHVFVLFGNGFAIAHRCL